MRNHYWLVLFLIVSAPLQAQNFPGYRSGNYSGVNGVFFNPASIADSRYRWDLNIFSAGMIALNNNATFSFKELRDYDDDKIKTQLFGNNAAPATGMIGADFTGPSIMFNAGKKMSFAITTRVRTMLNGTNMDGKLASKIIDRVSLTNGVGLPYTIHSPGSMTAAANAWKEFGASAARVLVEKGEHMLKGGISVKYLAGSANGNLYVNDLDAIIDENLATKNYVIKNATGLAGVSMSGAAISKDFGVTDLLEFNGSGIGADLGLVYEYRPKGEDGYRLRAGVSLIDLGSVKYKQNASRTGRYNITIDGADEFELASLHGINLTEFNSFLAARPQYFTPLPPGEQDISVSLPATLQLDLDYHLCRRFYMSVAGQLAVTKINDKPQNNQYYSGFTFTPRYEGKIFGLYIPVNYNKLTKVNAGISLRTGPFFIGSGSCLTALFGNSRQADFHFGVHVSSLKRK